MARLHQNAPGRQPDIALLIPITEEYEGLRLDHFLVSVVPGQSRSHLQRLIEEGHVTVNGRPAKANLRLKLGVSVDIDIPEPRDPVPAPENIELPIVYEDADLVVVNKPPGMVVHPAAGHDSGTRVNARLYHVDDLSGIGGEKRPGIVHRLDRGTSGLMVVAKNDAAHQELARQFHDREVSKEYLALVWGVVVAGRRIEDPIGRDPNNRLKMTNRARRSREAVTRIVRVFQVNPALALAQIAIHTGRTHQIRVHLSSIGHPIVGDTLYGGLRRRLPFDIRAVLRLDRPFLHAAKLAFKHPRDGRRMEFESELPPDLKSVLDDLIEKSGQEVEQG